MPKRWSGRGLLLWAIFLVSFWLTLKSSIDELPVWLRGTPVEPWLSQFSTGNQNIHDILVGVIVSLFIYFLVVWLPERDKRRRVRRNLQLQYDSFKEGCIRVFLFAMGGSYDPAVLDGLKDREQFRRFFKEPFSPGQCRWDAVANGLNAEYTKSLIVEFEIFIAEVRFTLTVVDVENQEVVAYMKNLANILYRARNCSPEYDSVNSLLNLMWSVFAGWSFIEGYVKKDVIADMIEAM
jgi:hypothetical protein